ncbi:ubiquitin-conjugating enzyme E2 U [Bombina bombina]|uniref:ubiquitin-conjugating enzyme E2 U n=1 Tax=Bombina bombina TaxID=8345 RepID=UPI00235A6380|nr:ubiquitin-conjugating enzyme E2 U [Bombina bombina]
MHSRTYLLLEREYQELNEAQIFGISVTPVTENLLQWVAKVQGLKDSLWEGAVLQLTMTYNEKYNYTPPSIICNTIPYHPNVDPMSGRPCIDFLDNPEGWNTHFTMTSILLTIQTMLSNPEVENTVNLEAAEMLKTNPSMYRQMVLDCVKISRQIESGCVPDYNCLEETGMPRPSSGMRKINSVSFEDYHKNWTQIATSKATYDLKHMVNKEALWKTPYNETREKRRTSNTSNNIIIHGTANSLETTSKNKLTARENQSCLLCRISENFGLLSADKMMESSRTTLEHGEEINDKDRHTVEPWEQEAENLISWTNGLSAHLLDF